MNDGFRTLFRGYCEKLSKPNEARDQAIALICKARSDEAGMQTIRGDAGSVQTAGEFACEQDALVALKLFSDCKSSKSSIAP